MRKAKASASLRPFDMAFSSWFGAPAQVAVRLPGFPVDLHAHLGNGGETMKENSLGNE